MPEYFGVQRLEPQTFLCSVSAGWTSKVKVSAGLMSVGLVSTAGSLLGLQTATSSLSLTNFSRCSYLPFPLPLLMRTPALLGQGPTRPFDLIQSSSPPERSHSHNRDQSFNTWAWGEHAPVLVWVFLSSHVDTVQSQMTHR